MLPDNQPGEVSDRLTTSKNGFYYFFFLKQTQYTKKLDV